MEPHVGIVTGAGPTRSGRAIARRFARDGAAVVVADVNDAGGRDTVRLIEASGGRAAFVRADIRDERQACELIATAERTFDAVTVLQS
jgi:NAD(P)-dependent dehydrogenase (short-subunit alcohol dehydrogenase family)